MAKRIKLQNKNGETIEVWDYQVEEMTQQGWSDQSAKPKKKSIKLTRIIDGEFKIVDINSDQFEFFKPMTGDKFQVDQIIEKYNNRVIVSGAVYRPGTFSVYEGMSIKDLIEKLSFSKLLIRSFSLLSFRTLKGGNRFS